MIVTPAFHIARFAREAAESVSPGALVLDAGAGDSPYRHFFKHVVYEGADICARDARKYPHVKYQCDLSRIPVPSERYDLVLCTQVLEHVPNPISVLVELHRVLKQNGRLWISAPLYFQEHETPFDYFRYTQYGWRAMLSAAGFEVERIEWAQGYLGTVAYQMNLARHCLPKNASDFGGGIAGIASVILVNAVRPIFTIMAWWLNRMDRRYRYTGAGHCLDYCVVANKRPDK